MSFAQDLFSQKYPSLKIGLVLSVNYTDFTDEKTKVLLTTLYGSATKDYVAGFEAEHFDISAGSGVPLPLRVKIPTLSYVYFQNLGTNINDASFRKLILQHGWDYEDMYLHFKEDTYPDYTKVTSNRTIFNGKGFRAAIVKIVWILVFGLTG